MVQENVVFLIHGSLSLTGLEEPRVSTSFNSTVECVLCTVSLDRIGVWEGYLAQFHASVVSAKATYDTSPWS